MKDKEKILEKLNDFIDKDVDVYFEGDISADINIHNTKILLNNKHLILSDNENEEIIINLNELTDVIIEDYMIKFFSY